MKKQLIFAILIVAMLSYTLPARGYTGFYFSFYNSPYSYSFSNESNFKTSQSYSKGITHLSFSLYGDNTFEVNLSLYSVKNKFLNAPEYVSCYGIGFELGKVLTIDFGPAEKNTLKWDISAGPFVFFDFMKPEESSKLYFKYGLYFSTRVRINILSKFLNIKSVDLGYKYSLPFYHSYYSGQDTKIITYIHFFFIGVSL